jgi:hypothetical protein
MIPLFYDHPVALHPQAHGELGLNLLSGYGFASRTNAIPLAMSEFVLAAQSYPIAFTDEARTRAVAVVGLRADENLFVDAQGHWLEGAYIPAYVRRYPFLLSEYGEGEGVELCVESRVLSPSGLPIFRGDEPTELALQAMRFCQSVHAAEAATTPFLSALAACGLFEPRIATIQIPNGDEVRLAGFQAIDEARLSSLADEAFLVLRRQGWLEPIYSQIQSNQNWSRLGQMLSARSLEQAA